MKLHFVCRYSSKRQVIYYTILSLITRTQITLREDTGKEKYLEQSWLDTKIELLSPV